MVAWVSSRARATDSMLVWWRDRSANMAKPRQAIAIITSSSVKPAMEREVALRERFAASPASKRDRRRLGRRFRPVTEWVAKFMVAPASERASDQRHREV